jgi:glycine/D-amino acid oxidase-like deaminating enzyme
VESICWLNPAKFTQALFAFAEERGAGEGVSEVPLKMVWVNSLTGKAFHG